MNTKKDNYTNNKVKSTKKDLKFIKKPEKFKKYNKKNLNKNILSDKKKTIEYNKVVNHKKEKKIIIKSSKEKKKVKKIKFSSIIDNETYIYFKSLNIPDNILPFSRKKRHYIFKIRKLYLTLGELSLEQIANVHKYLKERNIFESIIIKLEKQTNIKYTELNNPVLFLMYNKLANNLMYNGKKSIVFFHLNKAISYIKERFNIKKPLSLLLELLYYNLVPIIKTRVLFNNKILGSYITIYQRVCLTIKNFVKGIKMHKKPLYISIVQEFLDLFRGVSYLNKYNEKIVKDIEEHKLYKFLELEEDELILFPEQVDNDSDLDNDSEIYDIDNIKNIDWLNFDNILKDLNYIILLEKINFQKKILKNFKYYIILKYFIDLSKRNELDIEPDLIRKYDLYEKHAVFTYPYFDDNYLLNLKKDKDYIDLTTKKKIIKYKETENILVYNEDIKVSNLNKREKKEILKLKLKYSLGLYKNQLQRLNNRNYDYYLILETKTSKIKKYKKGKFDFVFWEYIFNPAYLHLQIDKEDIDLYVKKNINNFKYFPLFMAELRSRNNTASNLTNEDILLLFMDENPNLINLDLKQEEFQDIENIYYLFENCDIWDYKDIEDKEGYEDNDYE